MKIYKPTKKEKEYKQEQYQIRYEIDFGICQKCRISANSMGHRISQGYYNIKKYGWDIIQHNFNISTACNNCNDSFNIGMKLKKCEKLVELIKNHSNEKLTSKYITSYINKL